MMRFFMVTATDSRQWGTEIEVKTHARIKEEARGPIQDGGTDHHTINANKYTWYGLFTIGKKWLQKIRHTDTRRSERY